MKEKTGSAIVVKSGLDKPGDFDGEIRIVGREECPQSVAQRISGEEKYTWMAAYQKWLLEGLWIKETEDSMLKSGFGTTSFEFGGPLSERGKSGAGPFVYRMNSALPLTPLQQQQQDDERMAAALARQSKGLVVLDKQTVYRNELAHQVAERRHRESLRERADREQREQRESRERAERAESLRERAGAGSGHEALMKMEEGLEGLERLEPSPAPAPVPVPGKKTFVFPEKGTHDAAPAKHHYWSTLDTTDLRAEADLHREQGEALRQEALRLESAAAAAAAAAAQASLSISLSLSLSVSLCMSLSLSLSLCLSLSLSLSLP
jgi:hypothetical protein